MEAIAFVLQWADWVLLLNPILTTLVVVYINLQKSTTEEPEKLPSISKIIKAAIIIESIVGILSFLRTRGFFEIVFSNIPLGN